MIELLLLASLTQTPKVVTCTVVEPVVTVRCGDDLYDIRQIHQHPDVDKELKRQWRLVAPMRDGIPHVDAPLTEKPVVHGQQVKAIITDDRFQPVGSCEVRVWQAVNKWRESKQGERAPMTLYTMPEDCQPQRKGN